MTTHGDDTPRMRTHGDDSPRMRTRAHGFKDTVAVPLWRRRSTATDCYRAAPASLRSEARIPTRISCPNALRPPPRDGFSSPPHSFPFLSLSPLLFFLCSRGVFPQLRRVFCFVFYPPLLLFRLFPPVSSPPAPATARFFSQRRSLARPARVPRPFPLSFRVVFRARSAPAAQPPPLKNAMCERADRGAVRETCDNER